MGLILIYGTGQTPLDEEEIQSLRLKSITTQQELDAHEQLNIEQAVAWTLKNRFKKEDILSEDFIKLLHAKMFGNVWFWAGKFRNTEKNIGVKWILIAAELRMLLDDTKFWIENQVYSNAEIALRFKHRLVQIHCFPNGNGRHSRLMADVLMENRFGEQAFSWAQYSCLNGEAVRKSYMNALKQGDKGQFQCLLEFAQN